MLKKPIIYLTSEGLTLYHPDSRLWRGQMSSWEKIPQGTYHILMEAEAARIPSYRYGTFYIDKVATLIDVLASRAKEGMVIFYLEKKNHTSLWVLNQNKCLLQRFIPSHHLSCELEKTKCFLERFKQDAKTIHIYKITFDEILEDLTIMPKSWCPSDHPLAWAQWYYFWCFWLKRCGLVSFIMLWGGIIGNCIIIRHDLQTLQDMKSKHVLVEPMPQKASLFTSYHILKKDFSKILKAIEPLLTLLHGEWVADDIEKQEHSLCLRFQVDPDYWQDVPLKQQEIQKFYHSPLTWDVQNGDPAFIRLHIPLS